HSATVICPTNAACWAFAALLLANGFNAPQCCRRSGGRRLFYHRGGPLLLPFFNKEPPPASKLRIGGAVPARLPNKSATYAERRRVGLSSHLYIQNCAKVHCSLEIRSWTSFQHCPSTGRA